MPRLTVRGRPCSGVEQSSFKRGVWGLAGTGAPDYLVPRAGTYFPERPVEDPGTSPCQFRQMRLAAICSEPACTWRLSRDEHSEPKPHRPWDRKTAHQAEPGREATEPPPGFGRPTAAPVRAVNSNRCRPPNDYRRLYRGSRTMACFHCLNHGHGMVPPPQRQTSAVAEPRAGRGSRQWGDGLIAEKFKSRQQLHSQPAAGFGYEPVGATGFEPATSWSQSSQMSKPFGTKNPGIIGILPHIRALASAAFRAIPHNEMPKFSRAGRRFAEYCGRETGRPRAVDSLGHGRPGRCGAGPRRPGPVPGGASQTWWPARATGISRRPPRPLWPAPPPAARGRLFPADASWQLS
jgi:hypothetical protein